MGQYSFAEAKPIAAPSPTVAKGAYRLEEAKPLAQDGGIISSPPPSRRDSAGDAAQKSSADLYPTFSKIPGFDYVRPLFDASAGAGIEASQHAADIYDFLRKIPGADKLLPESKDFQAAITAADPNTTSSEIGKSLEGMAEFMIPAAKMTAATKGARLLTRAGGQALVGGGVSAVQSGGDPTAIATGAALGAGGELIGSAVQGAKKLMAGKSPTLANFSESFGNATPTQKARISKALDVLKRDGIVPPDSVHEMQDVVKGKLDELGKAYQALDPAIAARTLPVQDAVKELQTLRGQFMRRGVVTDSAAYDAIGKQIEVIENIAAQNGGNVQVDDLIHLKQLANGKTSFNSPDADKSLWRGIGDAYRKVAGVIAPETIPLNQDYQKYKDLEQIVEQNIARGKGTTDSGLTALGKKMASHGMGAAAGASLGGAILGPVGAAAGSVAGGIIGPKLSKAAAQAIQNAVDAGAFQQFHPLKQQLIKAAAQVGDNAAVIRLLGTSVTQERAANKPTNVGELMQGAKK